MRTIELFAGAGGLALGLEKAGFETELLCELNKHACATLRKNRPHWNVAEGDVSLFDFSPYRGKIDLISGGFPCQAFSYVGKRLGFEDTRGTMFFEFARAIQEVAPKMFLMENVRGLLNHDNGITLSTMLDIIETIGYTIVVSPFVLQAQFYRVPQKRERLFIIGIRNDLKDKASFLYPPKHSRIMTLRDAFLSGELYDSDVPSSIGQLYNEKKKAVLDLVPEGGYWKHLPIDIQKAYMKKSFYLGGGKTGMARRLSMDEPSLTLTCAPAQNQTERCHPKETRPLQIREYARIQTFPDLWEFSGSIADQYRQIGNAVPVNLAYAVGAEVYRMLQQINLPGAQS